ncbi:MAG TPA: CAP domain-containing protein [Ktedonobacteraceae bacterium]
MRRICWYALALLLLLSLAGCDIVGGSPSQQATNAPSPTATTANGNAIETVTPTPDPSPTATVAPTATASPTATPRPKPTVRPTARPTSSTQGGGTSSGLTSVEKQLQQQLFALINHDRASQSLYAYTLNSTMSGGALLHSKKMAVCGMSHQCPGEASPCQRVSNEGISWTSCGENVGYTSPNPTDWSGVEKIEQAMLAEQPPDDGHRLNLLNSSYHRIGVGIYIDSKGLVWITEDFAS